MPYDFDAPPKIRELFLGKSHAILLDDPIDRGPAGSAFVRLLVFRRGPISKSNSHESSLLDHYPQIKDSAGIMAWQPVDGGLYYLTGDQRLHLLQGAQQ